MTNTPRPATEADHTAIATLIKDAFASNEPSETAAFVDAMRAEGCLLGEWVTADASGLLAHIAFSRVHVEEPTGTRTSAAILTPLAVRSDRQRKGLGTQLMQFALEALERRGEHLFFVLGHPAYYPRCGFSSAPARSVTSPWGSIPAFMVRGTPVPSGILILPRSIADAH